MPCDNSTSCAAILDLAPPSSLEPRESPNASEQNIATDQAVKRCRSGPHRDRSESKAQIIPDSTQTVPEYVWGDEGPVND
jgi:hypothetical protein